jgi:hypothetical protein
VARVTRLDHNLGKIHDAKEATFELKWFGATASRCSAPKHWSCPAPAFTRPGWAGRHRQFLAGLPGVQRKAATASSSAALRATGCRRWFAQPCLEFFGQVRDSTPAIVEIKNYSTRGRTFDPPGPTLDERYVKAVGYAPRPSVSRPKVVLLGDIVGENEDGVASNLEVIRRANARGAEELRRGVARGAQEILAARARRQSRRTPTRSRSTRTW